MDTQINIRMYCSAATWIEGRAVDQLKKVASWPGVESAVGMPDLHPGPGTPVGMAFACRGRIYPEFVGGDAGCGMALWRLSGKFKAGRLERRLCDAGVTPEAGIALPEGWPDELRRELGSIGQGNHFIEILEHEGLWLLVHAGSRGHGQGLARRTPHGGIAAGSEAGREWLAAQARLIAWARLNREVAARSFLALAGLDGEAVLDNCHNGIEAMPGDSELWIHRKGAASTSPGECFIIAGSRGAPSCLAEALGGQAANLYSAAHGAGRKWDRHGARARMERRHTAESLRRTRLGGIVVAADREALFEEAPEAYKPIEPVVETLVDAGILRVIAWLKPVLTWKAPKEYL